MKKKYIFVGIIIFVLVVIGLFVYHQKKVADAKEQYFNYMNAELDKLVVSCPSSTTQPISFSIWLFFAHEAVIEKMPLETLINSVDAFAEAGISRIDINMGFFPWLDNRTEVIEKYDKLIAHIRAKNLELNINPQFSSHYHEVENYADFKQKALSLYQQLAERYQPERFIVLHEPTTMNEWMKLNISPQQWAEFAKEASLIVKQASSKTKTGAGFLTMVEKEKDYFDELVKLYELDLITLDIYHLKGLELASEIAEISGQNNKTVYIEETGRPNFYVPRIGKKASLTQISQAGIGALEFQEVDIKWLQAMACFATSHNLEAVTPAWPQPLFKYTKEGGAFSPKYNQEVLEAINKGEHTKYFSALAELTEK